METWPQIREWRKGERRRLIAARMAFRGAARQRCDQAITAALSELVPRGVPVGFYWPIRGEPDLRGFVSGLLDHGARLALPVVVEKKGPVEFRAWRPDARMASGVWDIPVPAEGERVRPEVLLVPLAGFDECCYRLGYGAGYYDRTLAALPRQTLAIGVGYELSHLPTIYPQPHDVPMSIIVTEARVIRRSSHI
jgi:5,10-methenyltetrahydrofolate synthetase